MGVILEVQNLKKDFDITAGKLHAVDNISFQLEQGKTLGVVGESGCGKSTLGKLLVGLEQATSGKIIFQGRNIEKAGRADWKALRKEMQMVFQDPMSSLDPRLCTMDLIAEPLKIFKVCRTQSELESRVRALMDLVGIAEHMIYAFPHELDGGRRQRIGIARALALEPEFIVCDEPVSALDVSIQAQVLNLLKQIQRDKGLSYLFITHDLSVVKHISDDILVMYMGQMVEKAACKELFHSPMHPYTRGLLSAIPIPSLRNRRKRVLMEGEITSPVNMKPGCRFAARCPYAQERCRQEQPALREVSPGHFVSCHFTETTSISDTPA
ncbi:ABC transporter ATP-binding protein [Flavonifractor sp. An306]|uniref:ABC transporter ATP-binding protein n=1 Tax=Flavonifractor sp. An306 TaxID=1965629 RepID=UPI00174E753C|nr:oligopeptide/dipeptide ABC transporter ATP-binding protein [Flavonifractor sp. An306]